MHINLRWTLKRANKHGSFLASYVQKRANNYKHGIASYAYRPQMDSCDLKEQIIISME